MNKTRTIKVNKLFLISLVFLFALIILKLSYVGLSSTVDGINLTEFAKDRNTVTETIVAERGTIYNRNNEILAQNITSYTVIAYLDSSRTTDASNPHHVVDKEKTAEALSPIINMTKERILSLLNTEGVYQVELGPGGRGITELVKDEIEALALPGIDFIKSTRRYYPNGDFLSYTLGYAKSDDNGNIIGEFGLELMYDEELTGKNGSKTYEQDLYGYQIANTTPIIEPAESGSDIYLTIDTNIQLFAEQAITTLESASLEWASVSVVNAKTGEILAIASNPSFNPNIKDIEYYYDPFVSNVYEPGSTIKIFSFMAAIEEGLYKGEEKYKSGSLEVGEYKVSDWNKYGWGNITYNQGFYASSNVAATLLAQELGLSKLKSFYEKLGFNKKTGVGLPNEKTGTLNFKYDIELANASFGQGMSVTPVEMIQALTTIANDGTMIKPYLVSKIEREGKIIFEGKREEIEKIASKNTIDQVKDLMYGVVNSGESLATGSSYKVDGVNVIGKTGTAQIASPNGGYLTGYYDNVRSFAALFPYEDPEIIVYAVVSKITNENLLPKAVTTLIEDVSTYLGIQSVGEKEVSKSIKLDSYINKETEEVKKQLADNKLIPIVIGNGDKIIKQYPSKNTTMSEFDKVFLLTNSKGYTLPDIIGWSKGDVEVLSKLTGIKVNYEGYGYVTTSSLPENSALNNETTLNVLLAPKYTKKEKTST